MRKTQVMEPARQDDASLHMLLMVWLYRILLVLTMAGGICWLKMLPARDATGEFATVLVTYTVLVIVLQSTYHACDVGHVRVSELVMSQILANMVSMGLVCFGEMLYSHSLFNLLPVLAVLAVQSLLGGAWSVLANWLYFRNRRPLRTAVIYRDDESLRKLVDTPYFRTRYEICKLICQPEEDVAAIRKEIEGCEVVFTIGTPVTLTNSIAKLCVEMDVEGCFIPHLGQIILAGARYMSTFSVPMLRVKRAGGHSEYRALKRVFDLCIAVTGIVITSPIMLVTALAIWLEDRGPVLYSQVRLTKNGRKFRILKFRSMNINAEKDGVARLAGENDSRITAVGRFIRACRIDELPQLFNILVGDMSVVGPRPERPEIAEQYQQDLPEFELRLQVKAGLTGLAQVYGRYNTEPYNKLQMDLMYINEMSFLKDLQLILMTIRTLFQKESTQGVGEGKATARVAPAKQQSELRL